MMHDLWRSIKAGFRVALAEFKRTRANRNRVKQNIQELGDPFGDKS